MLHQTLLKCTIFCSDYHPSFQALVFCYMYPFLILTKPSLSVHLTHLDVWLLLCQLTLRFSCWEYPKERQYHKKKVNRFLLLRAISIKENKPPSDLSLASLVAQRLKHLSAMWETWVLSLGQEDPLEKEMAIHSSILAWRIPWVEEPGGLQFTGSPRVGHDWAILRSQISYNQTLPKICHFMTLAWELSVASLQMLAQPLRKEISHQVSLQVPKESKASHVPIGL